MKKILSPILLLLLCITLHAQDEVVAVDKVDFTLLRDKWVQMEVQLTADKNTLPNARDEDYVEKVKVKVYLGYLTDPSAREFDYYTSQVEIVMMEQGDKNNVYFYMPGMIVDRDELDTEPTLYYVEVSVGETKLNPQDNAMSSAIANPDILNKFINNAVSEGQANEHLLMPIYYAPTSNLGRVDSLPVFLRRDVTE